MEIKKIIILSAIFATAMGSAFAANSAQTAPQTSQKSGTTATPDPWEDEGEIAHGGHGGGGGGGGYGGHGGGGDWHGGGGNWHGGDGHWNGDHGNWNGGVWVGGYGGGYGYGNGYGYDGYSPEYVPTDSQYYYYDQDGQ